jgi:hypothetical protein
MLIADINGVSASTHTAARLFVEEGFAITAMGLQARTERLRPRGFAGGDRDGTAIATLPDGGHAMADRTTDAPDAARPRAGETSETERERIRSSNDRDQALEREGTSSDHNRGYDEAARGADVDPDSAESDVDRDDTVSDR